MPDPLEGNGASPHGARDFNSVLLEPGERPLAELLAMLAPPVEGEARARAEAFVALVRRATLSCLREQRDLFAPEDPRRRREALAELARQLYRLDGTYWGRARLARADVERVGEGPLAALVAAVAEGAPTGALEAKIYDRLRSDRLRGTDRRGAPAPDRPATALPALRRGGRGDARAGHDAPRGR